MIYFALQCFSYDLFIAHCNHLQKLHKSLKPQSESSHNNEMGFIENIRTLQFRRSLQPLITEEDK